MRGIATPGEKPQMKTDIPVLAQYELQQRLRSNGTSEVWRAHDTYTQRTVLVKIFRANPADAADIMGRYIHNIKRIVSLHHPNTVPIYDVQTQPSPDSPTSLVYLTTQYIEGESFAEYMLHTSLTRKTPSPGEIVDLFSSLALAIDSLHRQGIVHGNLKPTNILLDQRTITHRL
jgi:serine/threonine-protein kinase